MAPYQIVTLLLCLIFLALAAIHFYWAVGGRMALAGAVPSNGDEPLFTPGPVASALVGCALVAAASIAALRGEWLLAETPDWLPRVGTWMVALVFAGRAIGDFRYFGFFKRVRGTLFAHRDSRIYSPLCAAIASLAVIANLLAP